MLHLRTACTYRELARCILTPQRRFTTKEATTARPPSKYKAELKNLIGVYKKELGAAQANAEKESIKLKAEEQNEVQRMLKLNELENEKINLRRAERLTQENEAKLARRMKGDERRADIKREVLEEQTGRVKRAIQQSSTFITRENLDQRIEKILDSPKNFDFCLTKSGKMIIGKI